MTKTNFPKLASTNYPTWSLRMQAKLVKMDLWDVTAPVVVPPNPGDVIAYAAALAAAQAAAAAAEAADPVRTQKALAEIMLHVEDEHLLTLKNARTARVAWQLLENTFRSKTTTRVLTLRRELNALQKDPAESLTQYSNRAKTLVADLAEMGVVVEPSDLTTSFLSGLPPAFDMTIEVLSSNAAKLDLDTQHHPARRRARARPQAGLAAV